MKNLIIIISPCVYTHGLDEKVRKTHKDLKRMLALPVDYPVRISTTIRAGDYVKALQNGWGLDELIRAGITLREQLDHYQENFKEMQERLEKQEKAIISLQMHVTNTGHKLDVHEKLLRAYREITYGDEKQ